MEYFDIKKYLEIVAIKLSGGKHDSPQDGMCIMECVAYIHGEEHSDHPQCACPVVTAFAIRTNDWMDDSERTKLLPFVLRIAGSRATAVIERQRAYMAADYAVRVFAPIALRASNLEDQAKRMEACDRIVDKASSIAGRDIAHQVHASAASAASASASASASAYAYAAADAADAADADAAAYAYAAASAASAADAAAASASASAYAYAADAADAAAAYTSADAYAAAAEYKIVRRALVAARLRLLDDMLNLTTQIEPSPLIQTKLYELEKLTMVDIK